MNSTWTQKDAHYWTSSDGMAVLGESRMRGSDRWIVYRVFGTGLEASTPKKAMKLAERHRRRSQ